MNNTNPINEETKRQVEEDIDYCDLLEEQVRRWGEGM